MSKSFFLLCENVSTLKENNLGAFIFFFYLKYTTFQKGLNVLKYK